MTVRRYDHSTWLQHRREEARALDATYTPPAEVALPGALQAIPVDRLAALQEIGQDQHATTSQLNAGWREEHADRLAAHARWTQGPYTHAIEEMRKLQIAAEADRLRQQALFEQKMAEWQAENDA